MRKIAAWIVRHRRQIVASRKIRDLILTTFTVA